MSKRIIIKGKQNISVELYRCISLECCRNDHLFCTSCCEILHYNIVTHDNILYDIQVARCKSVSCFSKEHLMCPKCSIMFHIKLEEKLI